MNEACFSEIRKLKKYERSEYVLLSTARKFLGLMKITPPTPQSISVIK